MDLDQEQAAGVVQMLKRGAKITKLNVDGTELDVPKLLETVVSGNGAHLNLPDLGPASAVIFADILGPPVFEGARTLKILNTRGGRNGIDGAAAQKLATAVLRTESLEKFNDIPIKKLQEDQLKGLKEEYIDDGKFTMSGKKLGAVEGIVLGELVKGRVEKGLVIYPLATLKELLLPNNNLGVAGGVLMGHALKKNQAIEKLDLADNHLTGGYNASAIQAIAAGMKQSPSLTELILDRNVLGSERVPAGCTKKLGAALAANPKLKKLSLSYCYIEPPGIVHIADGVKKNHVLTDLNLKGNKFIEGASTEGLAALAKMVLENASLEHLHLGYDLDQLRSSQLVQDYFRYADKKSKAKTRASALEAAEKELAKNIGDRKGLKLH